MSIGHDKEYEIAAICGFTTEIVKATSSWSRDYKKVKGPYIAPKEDLYFEILELPSREGSIGKLVDLTITSKYSSTPDDYHLEFEGRKKILKFSEYNLTWRQDYKGPTVYNYYAKNPEKQAPIPDIKNKFGQTYVLGDLVIAVGGTQGYSEIVLGYVTRWTKHGTLFLKPYGPFGSITNYKKGDIRINDTRETIIVPEGADLEKDLFTLVLGADYNK